MVWEEVTSIYMVGHKEKWSLGEVGYLVINKIVRREWDRNLLANEWTLLGFCGALNVETIREAIHIINNMDTCHAHSNGSDTNNTVRVPVRTTQAAIKTKIKQSKIKISRWASNTYNVKSMSDAEEDAGLVEGVEKVKAEGVAEWQPSDLMELLHHIGALKDKPPHPARAEMVRRAKAKWKSSSVITGVAHLNEADPDMWLEEGFLVLYGDGSAEPVPKTVFKPLKTGEPKKVLSKKVSKKKRKLTADEEKVQELLGEHPKVQTYEWSVGTGVYCDNDDRLSMAFHIPPGNAIAGVPTIAVGEGLAMLASFLKGLTQALGGKKTLFLGDAQFWINWALNIRPWLQRLSSHGCGKFGNIKCLIASAALLNGEIVAAMKCKGHAFIEGNERADEYANIGRVRQPSSWDFAKNIDWGKVKDFLIEVVEGEDTSGAARGDNKVKKFDAQGPGVSLRYERVTEKVMRSARLTLLPVIHRQYEKATKEWDARSSDDEGFKLMDARYSQLSSTIFSTMAALVGTRVKVSNSSKPVRHTSEYKERVARLKQLKAIYGAATKGAVSRSKITDEQLTTLLEFAECEDEGVHSAQQWKALLQLCQVNMDKEEADLEASDLLDREDAKKRSLYAATMRGDFRIMKMIILPQEVIQIEVDEAEFATHTAKLSTPPPGWVDQRVHLESLQSLRQRFGEPPGRASQHADAWLLSVILRSEVVKAWSGKKRSSMAGSDSIPYCVREGLVRKAGEIFARDLADWDALCYRIVREAKQTFKEWKTIIDFILPKGGKDDYSLPKSYRNISCSVVPSKALGFIYWDRMSKWLQLTNRGGDFQVFGRSKGFPGATYAVKVLSTILTTAQHYKLNVLILMVDLDAFYPRLLKWVIYTALVWLGVPMDAVCEFMAVVGDKEAIICKGTEVVARYALYGAPQGCSLSVLMMAIVTILIGHQVVQLQLGFIFPCGADCSPAWWTSSCKQQPGVAYADDLYAATGGGLSWEHRLPADVVIANMRIINQKLMDTLRALCLPVGHTKTLVTGYLFDNEGKRYHPSCELSVFTEKGEQTINYSPLEDILPHLGIQHEVPECSGNQLRALELEQEIRIHQLMHDPDLHPKMLLDMWFISLMGKWKYVASKVEAPREDIEDTEKMSRKVVRKILKIHNLPVPCLHAAHKDYGLGLPDLLEFKMLAALHVICSLAFSTDPLISEFFGTYLQMTKQINNINSLNNPDHFTFFDWDTSKLPDLKIKRWPWQNDLVLTLQLCRQRQLEFKITRSGVLLQQREWCMCYMNEAGVSCEVSLVKKAVGIARAWMKKRYALELKFINRAGEVARTQSFDKKLSNAWKQTGKLTLSQWSFQIKAIYRMLISPAKKNLWDPTNSASCVLCGHPRADQTHILSCCDRLKSTHYVWRHDQVLKELTKAVQSRWQVITAEQNALKRWIPRGIAVDTAATKPDLTLLHQTASKDILVRIVDVTIPYDESRNFRNAAQAKLEKYEPIRQAIIDRAANECWGRNVEVLIVPVIVGTLGVIQSDWSERMGELLIPADEANSLGAKLSCIAIQASQWVWNQFHAQANAHTQNR